MSSERPLPEVSIASDFSKWAGAFKLADPNAYLANDAAYIVDGTDT